MKELYIHPQETWDRKRCLKESKRKRKDGLGTPYPYKGLIALDGSPYPSYGQTRRYNGGTIIEGEHFHREQVPLPKIDDDFEIVHLLSWGYQIRKKV